MGCWLRELEVVAARRVVVIRVEPHVIDENCDTTEKEDSEKIAHKITK